MKAAGMVEIYTIQEYYEESERIINGYFDPEGYHDEETISFIYELDNRKNGLMRSIGRKLIQA